MKLKWLKTNHKLIDIKKPLEYKIKRKSLIMVAGKALKRFKGPYFYIGPLRGVMNKKLEKNGFLKHFQK